MVSIQCPVGRATIVGIGVGRHGLFSIFGIESLAIVVLCCVCVGMCVCTCMRVSHSLR